MIVIAFDFPKTDWAERSAVIAKEKERRAAAFVRRHTLRPPPGWRNTLPRTGRWMLPWRPA